MLLSEKMSPKIQLEKITIPAQGRFRTCQSNENDIDHESVDDGEVLSPASQSENLKKRISTIQGE